MSVSSNTSALIGLNRDVYLGNGWIRTSSTTPQCETLSFLDCWAVIVVLAACFERYLVLFWLMGLALDLVRCYTQLPVIYGGLHRALAIMYP